MQNVTSTGMAGASILLCSLSFLKPPTKIIEVAKKKECEFIQKIGDLLAVLEVVVIDDDEDKRNSIA